MPNLQHLITLPHFLTLLFISLILSAEGRPLNGLTINLSKRNSLILRKLGSFLGKTTSPIAKSYSQTHSESTNINQYLKPETSDDYRPTTPGRSPGAGHPEQESVNSKVAAPGMVLENDFRPTSPGSSPGAGHSETHSDNEQVTAPTRFCVDGKCVDDFRPTAPGDSPGAGHSSTESAKPHQAIPMEQRKVKN